MKKSKLIFSCLIIVLMVAVGAVIWRTPLYGNARAAVRPPVLGTPTIGPVRDILIAKGVVAYDHQLVLRSAITGRVAALSLKEGDQVRRGQTLLDVRDTQDNSELQLRSLEQRRAQAKLEALEKEVAVVRRLVEIGSSPRFELEQKTLEQNMAAKDLERSKIDIARLGDKRAFTQLKSPVDGIVISLAVVQNQSVNAGEELISLAGGEGRFVVAYVDAMDVERLAVGQAVVFSDQEDGGKRRPGRVKEIGQAIANSQRQNTVKIIVESLEPLAPIKELRISQQLYVEFVLHEEAAVLRVPRELMYMQGDQKLVNVLTKDGVRARQIQTVRGDATFDKVIAGIDASDQLVRKGAGGLK